MKNDFIAFTLGLFLVLTILSCQTEDVTGIGDDGPPVSLSSDKLNISENEGFAFITANLATTSTRDVTVTLYFSGSATGSGVDFTMSSEQIIVPAGTTSASTTLLAVQDDIEEGTEEVIIGIEAIQGGVSDGVQEVVIFIEDDDAPLEVNLLLNEILYDPSNSGLEGDANGDGQYAQNEDEFLEFVNLSSGELDLSGYKIFDEENLASNSPNHLFPSGSIVPPGKAIVVFGGGTPTGSFGNAIIQTSTSGDLNLNNAGDVMYLYDTQDSLILSFDIEPLSNNPNESYTRNPDITGEFEQHGSVLEGVLFSPGTKIDGSPF
jgi:hypothetical protein